MLKDLNQLKNKSNYLNILNQNLLPVVFFLLKKPIQPKEIEQKWKDELNGQKNFSHGKSNLCGASIAFFGSKSVTITKEFSDNSGRILVL